ncbi:FAD-dependent oxidoreductase [Pokkaliibacter sp. CJK22405]|uniref:FAD-dependent oxidoreductase n=1 Tax=Pokkaliibacter sp. CJK22405 TaxID=3384615 RepID=UPI0039854B86
MNQHEIDAPIVVLGGGPAGLMAAWQLQEAGKSVVVLEKAQEAGGMCATLSFQGKEGDYRFDYGGHRFITKNPKLLDFVDELMGESLLHAERKSVIRFRNRTYDYPLSAGNLLKNAPFSLLAGAAIDWLKMPFRRRIGKNEDCSFAEWITNRFGKTLYQHFFEGYTRKLWGIEPATLSADWAGQRISLIDLKDVVRRLWQRGPTTPRTYARKYRYPKLGFGQIFTTLHERLEAAGVSFITQADVCGLEYNDCGVTAVRYLKTVSDQPQSSEPTQEQLQPCSAVVATIPLPEVCRMLSIPCDLNYRSLRFFNLPMNQENVSDNTWQYLSDEAILGTRLQEPRRRSPFMAPEGKTSLMFEIPCQKGDRIWNSDEPALRKQVEADMTHLGLDVSKAGDEHFSAWCEHAYPIMDLSYRQKRENAIRALMPYRNLVMAGRQGTFRYIFTDTAMEMGLMAADMLISGKDERRAIFDHRNENTVIETQSVA